MMKKNKHDSGLNLGIIVEAKNEYTAQLTNVLKPLVYSGLLSMYESAIQVSESDDMILYHFQKELKNVPKWNNEVIKEETNRVLEECSYFNELITAVFLSNVRILTSVKIGRVNKKFQLVVPTNDSFIHQVYMHVSKSIYDNPYLFSLKKLNGNITNNIHDVFETIEASVLDTIRRMLPIKNILASYVLDNEGTDSLVGSDSESEVSEDDRDDAPDEPTTPPTIKEPDDNPMMIAPEQTKNDDDLDMAFPTPLEEEPQREPIHMGSDTDTDEDKSGGGGGGGAMDALFEKPDDLAVKEIPIRGDSDRLTPNPPTAGTTFFDD